LVTIKFSKPLLVPRDKDGKQNFQTLSNNKLLFATYIKNSENDYIVDFTFKPVEWDSKGNWCTI